MYINLFLFQDKNTVDLDDGNPKYDEIKKQVLNKGKILLIFFNRYFTWDILITLFSPKIKICDTLIILYNFLIRFGCFMKKYKYLQSSYIIIIIFFYIVCFQFIKRVIEIIVKT